MQTQQTNFTAFKHVITPTVLTTRKQSGCRPSLVGRTRAKTDKRHIRSKSLLWSNEKEKHCDTWRIADIKNCDIMVS